MTRRTLVFALVLLALGGFALHYRIHPFMIADKANPELLLFNKTTFLASVFPFIDVVFVTALFMSRRTAMYGYLLNGLIVIYGTIFMAHFSIVSLMGKSLPPSLWITNSLLPDIGIAWADFFVGKALFDYYFARK